MRFEVGAQPDACGAIETLELAPLAGGTYSAMLMPAIAAMLERHRVEKSAIGGFGVASGPGSFTGLRVGLSTVKALADALDKPIAAISVLEAAAWKAETQGRLLTVIDAGRRQVFVGEFLADGVMRTRLRERLLGRDEFLNELKQENAPVFTPDPGLAENLAEGGKIIFAIEPPMADLYARLGAARILAGNVISAAELDANYIRRSDAEIFHKGG